MKFLFNIAFFLLIFYLSACCIAVKNPIPSKDEPKFTEQKLRPRFALTVGVRRPCKSDFYYIKNVWERDWRYETTLENSKRLVDILTICSLFEDVRLIDTDGSDKAPDIILYTELPPPSPSDAGAIMGGIYLGILPIYIAIQEGVYFKFVKGGTCEFRFDWLEEQIFSIYSIGIAAVSKEWYLTRNNSNSTYWEDLRESIVELIRTCVSNAQQYEN